MNRRFRTVRSGHGTHLCKYLFLLILIHAEDLQGRTPTSDANLDEPGRFHNDGPKSLLRQRDRFEPFDYEEDATEGNIWDESRPVGAVDDAIVDVRTDPSIVSEYVRSPVVSPSPLLSPTPRLRSNSNNRRRKRKLFYMSTVGEYVEYFVHGGGGGGQTKNNDANYAYTQTNDDSWCLAAGSWCSADTKCCGKCNLLNFTCDPKENSREPTPAPSRTCIKKNRLCKFHTPCCEGLRCDVDTVTCVGMPTIAPQNPGTIPQCFDENQRCGPLRRCCAGFVCQPTTLTCRAIDPVDGSPNDDGDLAPSPAVVTDDSSIDQCVPRNDPCRILTPCCDGTVCSPFSLTCEPPSEIVADGLSTRAPTTTASVALTPTLSPTEAPTRCVAASRRCRNRVPCCAGLECDDRTWTCESSSLLTTPTTPTRTPRTTPPTPTLTTTIAPTTTNGDDDTTLRPTTTTTASRCVSESERCRYGTPCCAGTVCFVPTMSCELVSTVINTTIDTTTQFVSSLPNDDDDVNGTNVTNTSNLLLPSGPPSTYPFDDYYDDGVSTPTLTTVNATTVTDPPTSVPTDRPCIPQSERCQLRVPCCWGYICSLATFTCEDPTHFIFLPTTSPTEEPTPRFAPSVAPTIDGSVAPTVNDDVDASSAPVTSIAPRPEDTTAPPTNASCVPLSERCRFQVPCCEGAYCHLPTRTCVPVFVDATGARTSFPTTVPTTVPTTLSTLSSESTEDDPPEDDATTVSPSSSPSRVLTAFPSWVPTMITMTQHPSQVPTAAPTEADDVAGGGTTTQSPTFLCVPESQRCQLRAPCCLGLFCRLSTRTCEKGLISSSFSSRDVVDAADSFIAESEFEELEDSITP